MRTAETTTDRMGANAAPGADGHARRSPASLVRELATDGRELMRLELELARAEMREKVAVYERNGARLAIGAGVLLAAAVFGMAALNRGLTVIITEWWGLGIGAWLAPLVLFVVVAAIGWAMVASARRRMRHENLKPRRTIQTLKEDKRWAERKVQA